MGFSGMCLKKNANTAELTRSCIWQPWVCVKGPSRVKSPWYGSMRHMACPSCRRDMSGLPLNSLNSKIKLNHVSETCIWFPCNSPYVAVRRSRHGFLGATCGMSNMPPTVVGKGCSCFSTCAGTQTASDYSVEKHRQSSQRQRGRGPG